MARRERVQIVNEIMTAQELSLSFDIYDARFCSWYEDGHEIYKSWVTINAECKEVALSLAEEISLSIGRTKYFYKAERFDTFVHFSLTVRNEIDEKMVLGKLKEDINTITNLLKTLVFAREMRDNGALLRKISPLRICCDGSCFEKYEKINN